MANMMAEAAEWLRDQLQAEVSELVTYSRSPDTVDLQAQIGETVVLTVNDSGFQVEIRSRDFIVDPANLILNAVKEDPQEGDRIFLTQGIVVIEYVVFRLAGEPVFRESDRYGNLIRIHTKELKRT